MPTHRMQATFHSRAMGGVPNTLVYPNKLFSVFMTELKNSLLREYIDRQNIYIFFKPRTFFYSLIIIIIQKSEFEQGIFLIFFD